MRELKPTLNKVVNGRNKQEYYQDNKERIANNRKQYYQEHKEYFNKWNRENYQKKQRNGCMKQEQFIETIIRILYEKRTNRSMKRTRIK